MYASLNKTSNPMFQDRVFSKLATKVSGSMKSEVMSVAGTVVCTGFLLALVLSGFLWVWSTQLYALGAAGAVLALILSLVMTFKPAMSMWLGIGVAIGEGLFLGAVVGFTETLYPGLPLQAFGLSVGVVLSMLGAYQSGLIKVTERFRSVIILSMAGLLVFQLFSMLMGLFFGTSMTLLRSGPIGMVFSVFVVILASLNLLVNFDFIERASEESAPKYMNWYAASGLIVSLVWLYVEILRLLSLLANNNED